MAQQGVPGRRVRGVALALLVTTAPLPGWADEPPVPPKTSSGGRRPRDDKRRTVRSYGSNLLHNTIAVPKNTNHKSFLLTATFTASSFMWDDEVKKYFAQHPHQDFGDIGAAMGGTLAIAGLGVGFFAIGRVSRGDRFRAATYDASQAIIVTQIYTQAIKLVVRRERPDQSNRLSFPSGHASNAFALAGAIGHHYGLPAEIVGYGVATFVATSRCAANKHYFSDVIAGSGLGLAIGRTVARRNGRPPGSAEAIGRRVDVALAVDGGPAGDGRGVALRIAF